MGKSRRSRANGGQRADPMAKPVKPPSDPELAALREKSILPVLAQLQSSDPRSRSAAAGAVANIAQDRKCRKLLLREQIVHILLTQTLTDASLESRAAGWDILRVLTAEEDPDFCVHLYRIDVLTAIQHACAKITETLLSPNPVFAKSSKAEQSFIWSISESLAAILAAVAEAQDEALDAASQNHDITRFLFTIVQHANYTAPTLQSTLSCVVTLSEDNEPFANAILNNKQCYKQLVTLKTTDGLEGVLACAVLHNIFSTLKWNDQKTGQDGACDAVLVPELSRALESTTLVSGSANGPDSQIPADIGQVALEVLASIGTALQDSLGNSKQPKVQTRQVTQEGTDTAMDADDDDDASVDKDQAEEDDEMDEDEMKADMEMVTGVDKDGDEHGGIDDLPTLKALIHSAIPQTIRIFRTVEGDDDASALIRAHALAALSNIAWTVSCLDFNEESNAVILQEWEPVAGNIWRHTVSPVLASDTSDVSLATMVTTLAWAVARTLHKTTFVSGEEPKKFISLYHASRNLDTASDDPFQSLGVKCIGVLGQLALDPAPVALNREIGVFLVTVVAALPETPVADAVEALNQLFDIYGDEKKLIDKEVFWKDAFLPHLEAAVSKVKAMVKTVDKRKSTELRIRAEEASQNLSRFIEYKKKHRP
ncbi:hypothetical protein F5Y16DRAFT_399300 [Xylariaceae sp. FL0255]|nr:hypothetical protein F5Y16DRAFT_399300 [Xylariaceae sp. FL0255]